MKSLPLPRKRSHRLVLALTAAVLIFILMTTSRDLSAPTTVQQLPPLLQIKPDDRILVLAPHPDDEVIGAGGIIQEAVKMGIPVHIVYLTYGDANQWSFALYRHIPPLSTGQVRQMGELRHNEGVAAAAALGVPAQNLTFLGYPDHDTLQIWYRHWASRPPAAGIFTRATAVPYKDALRPGAAYKGEEILRDMTAVIRDFHPTKIIVAHPADHNPDHRADYLFARVALWNLDGQVKADVYPFLVHYPHFPQPAAFEPAQQIEPPQELQASGDWLTYPISKSFEDTKLLALEKHATQYDSNPSILRRFIRANELFGDYPIIQLKNGASAYLLDPAQKALAPNPLHDELNAFERSVFVEIQGIKISRDGQSLTLSLDISRPLEHGVLVSLFVFGYRQDTPFGNMPKIHVQFTTGNSWLVEDQDRPIKQNEVQVEHQGTTGKVRIPLDQLGSPHRLLIAASSRVEGVPLDSAPWRVVELP